MATYTPIDHPGTESWKVSPVSPTSGYHKLDDHVDPFSDHSTYGPNSPVSITVSNSSVGEEPQLLPVQPEGSSSVKATIQCCRCDERQDLLPDWGNRAVRQTATCVKCTSAFCSKCVVSSAQLTQFDSKCKAAIPAEVFDLSYHWLCNTCGSLYDVPVSRIRRKNGIASVELKSLECEPCQQKATSLSLVFASVTNPSRWGSSSERPVPPPLNTRFSDGFFRKPTWTTSPAEPRRSWSFKSLKRWTTISSFKQYRPGTL